MWFWFESNFKFIRPITVNRSTIILFFFSHEVYWVRPILQEKYFFSCFSYWNFPFYLVGKTAWRCLGLFRHFSGGLTPKKVMSVKWRQMSLNITQHAVSRQNFSAKCWEKYNIYWEITRKSYVVWCLRTLLFSEKKSTLLTMRTYVFSLTLLPWQRTLDNKCTDDSLQNAI